ncbi:hypothetical protein MMC18_005997 [Xylographa bjoerkii]|nr:hypothetical protein [Xylographa bjoerkii]
MAPRTTRGAAAAEAAFLATAEKENSPQQLSSPPVTLVTTKANTGSRRSAKSTKAKITSKTKSTPVRAGDDNGESEPIAAKDKSKLTTPKTAKTPKASSKTKDVPENAPSTAEAGVSKKRKRVAKVKAEVDPNELPHGLGRTRTAPDVKSEDAKDEVDPPEKKVRTDAVTPTKDDIDDIESTMDTTLAASAILDEESPTKKARRTKKANPYGVTLGQTPYPDWQHPTPEDAHTSNGNAAMAVQGLIKRFGVLKSGMSKGCIDWNAARLAGREEIMVAIKRGGLAQTKSKYIEGILKMVHEENESRRVALAAKVKTSATKAESSIDPEAEIVDADHAEAAAIEKASEVMLADTSTLTLDYVHAMSANAAFAKLITFPGIGVKTASCTLLFCMQRPSFAVDTHVFRLCKWLGWVPPTATRDTTFAHCDVRVPDKLKYSLHQLLIKHGKECGRCRAITGEGSEVWEEGCVIDDLVLRTGKKKGGVEVTKTAKGKKQGKKGDNEMDEEDEVDDGAEPKAPNVKRTSTTTPKKRANGAKKEKAPAKAGQKRTPRKKAKKVVESKTDDDDDEEGTEDDDNYAED